MSRWVFIRFSLGAIVVGIIATLFVFGPILWASVAYPLPEKYRPALVRWSKEYGISPNFLAAIIMTESTWRENARSHAGAIGLTQFIPSTARVTAARLGVTPFRPDDLITNPELSIRFGAYYISEGLKRYNGDKRTALVAYNGGGGAVNAWRAGFPIRGTLAYADKVLAIERAYDKIYGNWWELESLGNSQELKIEPRRDVTVVTSIPIIDFWRNLLYTRVLQQSEEKQVDLNNFWQNLLGT